MKYEAHRVSLFRPYFSPDEEGHEHGRKGYGEERGEEHGEGLGVRERREQPAGLALERKDGQKSHRDDKEGEEERWTYLLCRLDHHIGRAPCRLPFPTPD